MPSFKPKANKKISSCKKSTITLDSKHNEKMKEFKKIEKKILPVLEDKKKDIAYHERHLRLLPDRIKTLKDELKKI